MSRQPVAIVNTGLVTSVGLNAPATCAAIRAKISNPTETRFIDSGGEWIMAHQVPLDKPWRGLTKLAKMAVMAIEEALVGIPRNKWTGIPLLLCVAEHERPGRMEGLDDELFTLITDELGTQFASQSAIVPKGRVSVSYAIAHARELAYGEGFPRVLIAATDSMLTWPTLSHYEWKDRLLTPRNSNGFIPGEGSGALLVGRPNGSVQLRCEGIGMGTEQAHIDSEEPLRADGLTAAIKAALQEAGCELHDLDFRITDLSGEQYYFKEAALALGRILRKVIEDFDIWHPAECIGEAGAAAGVAIISVANAAIRKGYTKGANILAHVANDTGQRSALVLQFRSA